MAFPTATAAGQTHSEGELAYASVADGGNFVWVRDVRQLIDEDDFASTVDTRAPTQRSTRRFVSSRLLDYLYNTAGGTLNPEIAATCLVGDVIETASYYQNSTLGGSTYRVVAAGTGTDDGGSYIDVDATIQLQGVFNSGKLDPCAWGVEFDNTGDDTNAWLSLLAYISANFSTEWPSITCPAGRTRVSDRLVFPGGTSVTGAGMDNTEFSCTTATAGIAVSNYDVSGQLTGTVVNSGTYEAFQVTGIGAHTEPLIWVGYCGHAHLRNVAARNAGPNAEGFFYSQSQEAMTFQTLSASSKDGYRLDYGSNGCKFYGAVAGFNYNTQVRIGSRNTTSSGATSNTGPGRNRFFGLVCDRMRVGSVEGTIVIESGRGNGFYGGRTTTQQSIPLVKVTVPFDEPVLADNTTQRYTIFKDFIFRDDGAAAYALDQDAASGDPIYFIDCIFENLADYPVFRTAGGIQTRERGSIFQATDITNPSVNLHSSGQAGIYTDQATDLRWDDDAFGPVLIDRTTGAAVRIYVDGGVMMSEPV